MSETVVLWTWDASAAARSALPLAIVPAGKQPKPTIRIVLDWDAMIAKR